MLVIFALTAGVAWAQQQDAETPGAAPDVAPTVLITGSNRGIGLEFARQYAALGWRVIATCRTPDKADDLKAIAAQHPNVVIERLDITDHEQVDALAERYSYLAIDVLLNNAALLGPRPSQAFGQIDYDLYRQIVEVNMIGTLKVTEAFAPHVIASTKRKIVTLGSAAGSIQMINSPPDFYAYRSSKAGLHLLMKNVALQLVDDDVLVALINPGLVDTRGFAQMSKDDAVPEDYKQIVELIRTGVLKLSTPEEAVGQMIPLIEELAPDQSGVFLNADGQPLPW